MYNAMSSMMFITREILNDFKPMNLKFLSSFIIPIPTVQEGILETKTDCSGKDRLFSVCIAFWVITFEPIIIQTCAAPQNARLNFSFVKDITVVVEKMTKNRRKMIGKTADSLLCSLHSIQFSPLVFLPLCLHHKSQF